MIQLATTADMHRECNRRGGMRRPVRSSQKPASGGGVSPLSIFLSTPPVAWWRGDLGATNVAGSCTALADQSGGGKNLTPLVGGPVITAADATLNNKQTLGFGTNLSLRNAAFAISTPFYYVGVVKPLTWNNTVVIFGDTLNANRGQVAYAGGSPNMFQNNGTFVNGAASTLGTWQRIRSSYTNSVADSLKVGSGAPTTGSNALNNSPGTLGFNGDAGSPGAGTFQMWEWVVLAGTPTAGELAAYDAYVTALTASAAQV